MADFGYDVSDHRDIDPYFLGITYNYDVNVLTASDAYAKALFQAELQFLANAIHQGQSPFWSPNVFGGIPQIADPQSLIFSPPYLFKGARPSITSVTPTTVSYGQVFSVATPNVAEPSLGSAASSSGATDSSSPRRRYG